MTALVIEHLQAQELPSQWLQQLHVTPGQTVTVRIEIENTAQVTPAAVFVTEDPAFGIWRDHDASANVGRYVQQLRAPRYNRDGSRNES